MSTSGRHLRFVLAVGAFSLLAAQPSLAVLVYPGDPTWHADQRGSVGSAAITGTNPRSGNGSLELETAGSPLDWGFFKQAVQDETTQSWGLLSDIDRLSFDWYRSTPYTAQDDAPWRAQTPVLRLLIREGTGNTAVFSELVWEKWYTDNGAAAVSQWTGESLIAQNLWRYVEGQGYTIASGQNKDPFFPDPLKIETPSSWAAFLSSDAAVWGLAVGVGSNWPDPYLGFADNVRLGFKGQSDFTVDANFELPTPPAPVPEPTTLVLLATGVVGLLGLRHRGRLPTDARD